MTEYGDDVLRGHEQVEILGFNVFKDFSRKDDQEHIQHMYQRSTHDSTVTRGSSFPNLSFYFSERVSDHF